MWFHACPRRHAAGRTGHRRMAGVRHATASRRTIDHSRCAGRSAWVSLRGIAGVHAHGNRLPLHPDVQPVCVGRVCEVRASCAAVISPCGASRDADRGRQSERRTNPSGNAECGVRSSECRMESPSIEGGLGYWSFGVRRSSPSGSFHECAPGVFLEEHPERVAGEYGSQRKQERIANRQRECGEAAVPVEAVQCASRPPVHPGPDSCGRGQRQEATGCHTRGDVSARLRVGCRLARAARQTRQNTPRPRQ